MFHVIIILQRIRSDLAEFLAFLMYMYLIGSLQKAQTAVDHMIIHYKEHKNSGEAEEHVTIRKFKVGILYVTVVL